MDAREAFLTRLYEAYAQKLRRFCQRYVGYRRELDGAVEECVQDVFLCAYRHYDQVKDHPNIQAWLYKTCEYRMLDQVKRHRRHVSRVVPEEWAEHTGAKEDIEEWVDTEARRNEWAAFFKTLTDQEQTLLHAHYVQGRTIREISQALEMNESTAKVTLMRLRRRAQKWMRGAASFWLLLVTFWLFASL